MKNVKLNFTIIVIIIGLFLDGCSDSTPEDNDINDGVLSLSGEMKVENKK